MLIVVPMTRAIRVADVRVVVESVHVHVSAITIGGRALAMPVYATHVHARVRGRCLLPLNRQHPRRSRRALRRSRSTWTSR